MNSNPHNPLGFPKPSNRTRPTFKLFDVPCNGCRICCQNGDMLRLLPQDNPEEYRTVPHPLISDALMLDHKDNGDCIYLGETGCTIYARRPTMCREMDCRVIAHAYSWTQMRKMSRNGKVRNAMLSMWRRGKELLKEQRTHEKRKR